MDQPTATLIAAIVAFLGVLGTATASLIAINIRAQKDREINQLKVLQDLQIAYDKDLRTQRIDNYMKLWAKMIPLARYPKPDTLTYQRLEEIAYSFRKWYFDGGGLVMAEDTRDLYFDLQDGLRILLQKRANHWSFDNSKIDDTGLLNKYLGRPETREIPEPIKDLAQSELPSGDDVPGSLAAHLRALGSRLRTSMTEDVLTRRETVLQSRIQSTSASPAIQIRIDGT